MNTTTPTGAESAAQYLLNTMMNRAYKKRFDELPECAVSFSSLLDDREVLHACYAKLRKMEDSGELAERGFDYAIVCRPRIVAEESKLCLIDLNVFTRLRGQH